MGHLIWPSMGPKWTGNDPEVNWKWTRSEPEVGRKWNARDLLAPCDFSIKFWLFLGGLFNETPLKISRRTHSIQACYWFYLPISNILACWYCNLSSSFDLSFLSSSHFPLICLNSFLRFSCSNAPNLTDYLKNKFKRLQKITVAFKNVCSPSHNQLFSSTTI